MKDWLHHDLNVALDAPIKSMPSTRGALVLIALVWQFAVGRARRWQKRDITGDGVDETFCNFFAVAVATAMGVLLPQRRANELADWLASDEAKDAGWERVDRHIAQRMADEGMLAMAVWKNPKGGSGHIAPLVPALDQPGTWIAQAGAVNFDRGLLEQGFGPNIPEFFAHP